MIDLSIVIPTKNEELTVSQFINWCEIGANRLGLRSEIILLDSSSDRTPLIAQKLGARVIRVDEPGLGKAYATGKLYARGKWILMGDADCTYDFREISMFIHELNSGSDLVIGNRFKGNIEKNSMPKHHRYFGTPATTWFFRLMLGIPVGDIHCGMRAMTTELYNALPFTEFGWEYSSEMIVCARNVGAKIKEVPIDFFKEPFGRVSHQKRNGWLTPFKAGIGAVRVAFTFALDRVLLALGISLWASSTLLTSIVLLNLFLDTNIIDLGILGATYLAIGASIGALLATIGALIRFIYRDEDFEQNVFFHRIRGRVLNIFTIFFAIMQGAATMKITQIYLRSDFAWTEINTRSDAEFFVLFSALVCYSTAICSLWILAEIKRYLMRSNWRRTRLLARDHSLLKK